VSQNAAGSIMLLVCVSNVLNYNNNNNNNNVVLPPGSRPRSASVKALSEGSEVVEGGNN